MMNRIGTKDVASGLTHLAEGLMSGPEASVARLVVEVDAGNVSRARDEARELEREANTAAHEELDRMRRRADESFAWGLAGAGLDAVASGLEIRGAEGGSATARRFTAAGEAVKAGTSAARAFGERSRALGDADVVRARCRKERAEAGSRRAEDEAKGAASHADKTRAWLEKTNAARLDSQRAAIRG
ncbi:MAG: hypothetical protein U0169_03770 [Polyangiaceae bacterium]